jgi:hypothetical protein
MEPRYHQRSSAPTLQRLAGFDHRGFKLIDRFDVDILDNIFLSLPCLRCGERYEIISSSRMV